MCLPGARLVPAECLLWALGRDVVDIRQTRLVDTRRALGGIVGVNNDVPAVRLTGAGILELVLRISSPYPVHKC